MNKLKAEIVRKYDKEKITKKAYNEAMSEIGQLIQQEIEVLLKSDKEAKNEETKMEKAKEVVPKEKPVKVKKETPVKVKKEKVVKEKKPKKISRQTLIMEALSMKSVNSVEKAVSKVLEKRPEDVPKENDVKIHVRWTIMQLKKGKDGKLSKYNFDAETFELSLKE